MSDRTGIITVATVRDGRQVIIAESDDQAQPMVRLLRSVNVHVDRVGPHAGRYVFTWPAWLFDGDPEGWDRPEPGDLGNQALELLRRMLAMYDAKTMTPVSEFSPFWADVRALLARAGKVQADRGE